jgi:hypothetical protein
MHNQYAGLSQALADQRITERHDQADRARLAGDARQPRRHRRRTARGWRGLVPRWLGGVADRPAARPQRAG